MLVGMLLVRCTACGYVISNIVLVGVCLLRCSACGCVTGEMYCLWVRDWLGVVLVVM